MNERHGSVPPTQTLLDEQQPPDVAAVHDKGPVGPSSPATMTRHVVNHDEDPTEKQTVRCVVKNDVIERIDRQSKTLKYLQE